MLHAVQSQDGLQKKGPVCLKQAKTPDLNISNYSRETVRIAFTYAALHGFNIMAVDILNAYLTAPILEKYWTICGPEFGPELKGCKAHIV